MTKKSDQKISPKNETKKSAQKIRPKNQPKKSSSTYTRVIHKDLTQAIQETSPKSVRLVWSPLGKPSL